MAAEIEGWVHWLEPAFLVREPGHPRYVKNSYMTWNENDEPKLTPEEEFAKISKQIDESEGFDIDFSSFRCIFNYHPIVLDSHKFVEEPETTEDLLKRLAQGSLDDRNKKYGTEFEFVKIVRANYHCAAAYMFLITFQVKDPYDEKVKNFRARVLHSKIHKTRYIFCEPEPNQGVECIGIKDVKEVVKSDVEKDNVKVMLEKLPSKKQRLE